MKISIAFIIAELSFVLVSSDITLKGTECTTNSDCSGAVSCDVSCELPNSDSQFKLSCQCNIRYPLVITKSGTKCTINEDCIADFDCPVTCTPPNGGYPYDTSCRCDRQASLRPPLICSTDTDCPVNLFCKTTLADPNYKTCSSGVSIENVGIKQRRRPPDLECITDTDCPGGKVCHVIPCGSSLCVSKGSFKTKLIQC